MQAWQYCIAKTGENYVVVVFDKDTVRNLKPRWQLIGSVRKQKGSYAMFDNPNQCYY